MIESYGVEELVRDLRAGACPVHGCDEETRGDSLMCRGHWRLVAADARREVYEAVRRITRIAKTYDRARDGSTEQGRLADEWLDAEIVCREVQLRAVIVASERAGARPDDVGSRGQLPLGKGGSMKAKIINDGADAQIEVTGEEGAVIARATVCEGQEVELSADGQISVGNVHECGEAPDTPTPDEAAAAAEGAAETGEGAAPADGAEPGGEGAAAGGATPEPGAE